MKKMLEKLREQRAALEKGEGDMSSVLLVIKGLLAEILLVAQIKGLMSDVDKIVAMAGKPVEKKPVSEMPLKDALDELETIATTKKDKNGKRTFLLHRLTADFEYEKGKGEDRTYETSEPTSWVAQFNSADQLQDKSAPGGGANPVVSCWVDEDAVQSVPNGLPNTGTWGDLGKNPHAHEYEVVVKPGKYELYQELKE